MNKYRNSKGQYRKGSRIKKICQQCRHVFFVIESLKRLKFCSSKCSGIAHSGKNNPAYKGLYTKKICKGCSNEFKIHSYHNQRKFCSHLCYLSFIKKENHPNWNGGSHFESYSIYFDNNLKDKIRKRDNYECQICHITEEEHIIVFGEVLSIHHIDYNKKNCEESKLISLCHSCHTRTNYNREYWNKYFEKLMGVKCGLGKNESY